MIERQAIVRLEEGLHARPAAELAKLAKSFTANLEIIKEGKAASAKSTVKIMLLGVKEGETITVRADGADEAAALEGLVRLIEDAQEAAIEATSLTPSAATPSPHAIDILPIPETCARIKGVSGGDGTSLGPVFTYFAEAIPKQSPLSESEIESALILFRSAVEEVCRELTPTADASAETCEIVTALIDIARDPEISSAIETRIRAKAHPVTAIMETGAEFAASFKAMESAYFQARAEDLQAISRRLAETILGLKPADFSRMKEPSIIAAHSLSALDFAKLNTEKVLGLVICEGGPTSHIAIMARAHGIPAVVGVNAETHAQELKSAKILAVNGTEGYAIANPDAAITKIFHQRMAKEQAAKADLEAFIHIHPKMRNGRAIDVAANIGSIAEIEPALKNGAMGVGLFRTEFLFMERKTLPTEEEQYEVYAKAAAAFSGRPVVIRTLDVGGDKPIAGIEIPHEENPFLGWRGIRMCLERPDLFKPQLRALLRAAAHGNVKIMFPMISIVGELTAARALLHECADELRAEGKTIGKPQLGVMIETPAAVMCAAEIAAEADFFSIGTNDLTQYTMAADRGHPRLAELNRADQPAVIKMIKLACEAANAAGKWVGVCGEAAGKPELIPLLLSFGVAELSMSPALIPRAKKIITQC